MKLIIPLAEVQTLLRRHLNLSSDVQIIVGQKPKSKANDWASISPELGKLIRYIDANYITEKIPAIKELRSQAMLMRDGMFFGLKEAKDIVENWPRVRPIFFKLKRIPNPTYQEGAEIRFI